MLSATSNPYTIGEPQYGPIVWGRGAGSTPWGYPRGGAGQVLSESQPRVKCLMSIAVRAIPIRSYQTHTMPVETLIPKPY